MDQSHSKIYDAIIIGAGISGVTFLKYARDKGLNCLVLEKQNGVGGLWKRLPSWQDIQNRTVDFAINGVSIYGEKQSDVHQYVMDWVAQYELAPHIKLNCQVTSTAWEEDHWVIQTSDGPFLARYVIAASGVQNKPWTPPIDRSHVSIREWHSSGIQQPEKLADKVVTLVGGGVVLP